jgi:hypothetical protein
VRSATPALLLSALEQSELQLSVLVLVLVAVAVAVAAVAVAVVAVVAVAAVAAVAVVPYTRTAPDRRLVPNSALRLPDRGRCLTMEVRHPATSSK